MYEIKLNKNETLLLLGTISTILDSNLPHRYEAQDKNLKRIVLKLLRSLNKTKGKANASKDE